MPKIITPSHAPFIHNHHLLNTVKLFEMNTVPLLLNTSSNTNYNFSGSGVVAFQFQVKKTILKKRKELLNHGDEGAGLVIFRILKSMWSKI